MQLNQVDFVKLEYYSEHFPYSKKVLVGVYPHKNTLYLGFNTHREAVTLREYLVRRGFALPYTRSRGQGVDEPRPAKNVPQKWELKVHSPSQALLALLANKNKVA